MRSSMNRFEYNPTSLKMTRSRFKIPHKHSTTFNAGDLIPFKFYEVLAGDTFSLDLSSVCRMTTPIFPVMDNAYMDVYFFFIPARLLWIHNNEFYGENVNGPWVSETEYEIPQIVVSGDEIKKGSIYDQLGLPLYGWETAGSSSHSFDARPVRAYGLIWNEWFRDQNVSAPLNIYMGDAVQEYVGSLEPRLDTWFSYGFNKMTTDWVFQGLPLPVAKFHDYFTSALPMPQKGPAVTLPLIAGDDSYIPVVANQEWHVEPVTQTDQPRLIDQSGNEPVSFVMTGVSMGGGYSGLGSSGTTPPSSDGRSPLFLDNLGIASETFSSLSAINVNVLRQAFAMQRLFEKDARGGTRFREIILTHFGVKTSDSRVQVPEFLAGKRIPISMTAVPQTSATSDVSPQGNLAAYSHTLDSSSLFTYSATEPGFIMGLCCVRTDHSYSQGIQKKWTRRRRFDFYWPVFANLGEQPIYNRELNIGYDQTDDEVFGYNEAWAEYRYEPNTVAGALRPDYGETLAAWTYADEFLDMPTLSPEFIYENRNNVDRTLAVKSTVEDQFIVDFYFNLTVTRPMPLYSIPGMTDHY